MSFIYFGGPLPPPTVVAADAEFPSVDEMEAAPEEFLLVLSARLGIGGGQSALVETVGTVASRWAVAGGFRRAIMRSL